MKSSSITLGDERVLCVHEFGDLEGRPVVFFHGGGLGATGLFAEACDEVARQRHLHILAPDRPGLGGSSPKTGRTVLDWPQDVAQMADALRIDTFPIVAHSGGAGYALACAWRLQDRVSSVHLTSTMVSQEMIIKDRTVPFKTKLSTKCFAAMPDFLLRAMFRKVLDGMQKTPEKTARDFLRRLPLCERPVLSMPVNQLRLRNCVASSFRQGTAAAIEDLHLIFQEWGIPLREVRQKVTLWHGENDTTAPTQTVKTLAGMLPSSELHLVPQAGHLTTWFCHTQDILGGL